MRKIFCALGIALCALGARANWEYGGGYHDDGERFTVSVRGGVAMPFAKMKNNLGGMLADYYTDGAGNVYDSLKCPGGDCSSLTYIGRVNLGDLPVAKKYDSFSWAGGASVGMTVAGNSGWRAELDWLHISESDYSANPLFAGDVEMTIGIVPQAVAGAQTTVSTDVISAMIYYDFFGGSAKPAETVIPYIGLGLGYATSTAALALSDNYGDLMNDLTICENFGKQAGLVCDYYASSTDTSGFSISGAVGFSYGIEEGVFLDIGARATFVPKIKWALNNSADTAAATVKEREIFSATNVVFTSVYAGVRFEF
jgi:hypothetical protein